MYVLTELKQKMCLAFEVLLKALVVLDEQSDFFAGFRFAEANL